MTATFLYKNGTMRAVPMNALPPTYRLYSRRNDEPAFVCPPTEPDALCTTQLLVDEFIRRGTAETGYYYEEI